MWTQGSEARGSKCKHGANARRKRPALSGDSIRARPRRLVQSRPMVLPLCFRRQLPREFGLRLGYLLETSSISSALLATMRQPVCLFARKHGCPSIFPNENLVHRLGACGRVLAVPHPHPGARYPRPRPRRHWPITLASNADTIRSTKRTTQSTTPAGGRHTAR